MFDTNTKRKYLAVIRSGYWGKNLVRNFFQLGALKLIYDKNENTLNQFKEPNTDVDTYLYFEDRFFHNNISADNDILSNIAVFTESRS